MKYTCALLAANAIFLVGLQPQIATATTLYDGSGLPEAQGWLAPGAINSSGNPIFPITNYQTIEPTTGNITVQTHDIDSSSASAGYLGYSNYLPNPFNPGQLVLVNSDFPPANAENGYSVFFNVAINPVVDDDDNRAAFSVIAISSDVTKGIELDFDRDRIFAQSDTVNNNFFSNFNRAETSGNFNTANNNSYELRITNTTYELFANGDSAAILSGNLRDYEFDITATEPNLPFNPYETPNFLFLGDLTDRASGTFTLGEVRVEAADTTAVPEFSPTLALALIGMGMTVYQQKYYSK